MRKAPAGLPDDFSSPGPGVGTEPRSYDAVVVGAGFSGLYTLLRLLRQGLSVVLVEAGAGVGGTWYWNRYPGARCDVESIDYSYSFDEALQQEWTWSERYPRHDELRRYLDHVADRFELRPHIELSTTVESLDFDPAAARWTVATSRGRVQARFVVMATGVLSAARLPDIPGIGSFQGLAVHTADWPTAPVDFTGSRVGVIGTGSSGIQVTTVIADRVRELFVFQRTAAFSLPAQNRPLDSEALAAFKQHYAEHRHQARRSLVGVPPVPLPHGRLGREASPAQREEQFASCWEHGGNAMTVSFSDVLTDQDVNDSAAEFVRRKIHETVNDPTVAETLTPAGFPFGAKRVCIDTGFYETFNRPNVHLVDVSEQPIERITPTGVQVGDAHYPLDVLVLATGFDAMSGSFLKVAVTGPAGTLRDAWTAGPRTYLGTGTAGFPNLFFVAGPGTPSVLTNMVMAIEQHVEWITELIDHVHRADLDLVEVAAPAQDEWVELCDTMARRSLYYQADSWYLGANVPGKPRVFMPFVGGLASFRKRCDAERAAGYPGFRFGKAAAESDQLAG